MKRGTKARAYSRFIVDELIPFIHRRYRCLKGPGQTTLAGCSLGGLSAIDIAWNYPSIFGKVGVFSGSFWWRSKSYKSGYQDDTDRIMHQVVREGSKREGLKFWFEAGTKDEEFDRNQSGIFDSIEDTLDLIEELKKKGYQNGKDVVYIEIEGGKHNLETWGSVMPEFLTWAFH